MFDQVWILDQICKTCRLIKEEYSIKESQCQALRLRRRRHEKTKVNAKDRGVDPDSSEWYCFHCWQANQLLSFVMLHDFLLLILCIILSKCPCLERLGRLGGKTLPMWVEKVAAVGVLTDCTNSRCIYMYFFDLLRSRSLCKVKCIVCETDHS